MANRLGKIDGNSPISFNFGQALLTQKGGWTAEELGIELTQDRDTTITRENSQKWFKRTK